MIITLNANALHIPLRDKCVQCVVTSPPYYALRDYGTATWIGGDPACEHRVGNQVQDNKAHGAITSGVRPGVDASVCKKCGALRQDLQVGLERTPEEYVQKLVLVFREVRRVLRDDGVLWLNIGDSYAGSGGAGGDYNEGGLKAGQPRYEGTARQMRDPEVRNGNGKSTLSGSRKKVRESMKSPGVPATGVLKPKDLIGIPWMLAFALRADGWYLRQEVIWHKPNCMPESATDRPTRAHEQLFLLSKSRIYFYDADAIREEAKWKRWGKQTIGKDYRGINPIDMESLDERRAEGRNKRSVWTIPTIPYSGPHFATFPPDLVRPCILAGTSEKGCCPECGAPWERVTEKVTENASNAARAGNEDLEGKGHPSDQVREDHDVRNGPITITRTIRWDPTCNCHPAEGDAYIPIPCTVLDPFAGTCTTGQVAAEHRRNAIGLELNFENIGLAKKRTAEVQPEMFMG